MTKPCIICKKEIDPHRNSEGKIFWTDGHNAEPIANGRCCSKCNNTIVIPQRITDMRMAFLEKKK